MNVLATRRSALDESLKEKLKRRVMEIHKEKNGDSQSDSNDSGNGEPIEDAGEGIVYLFDSPMSKEARIASSMVAKVFPSEEALNEYLKMYPDADRSKHSVVKDQGNSKKEDKDGDREPTEKEDVSKNKGMPEDKDQEKKDKSEDKDQGKEKPGDKKQDQKGKPEDKKQDQKGKPEDKREVVLRKEPEVDSHHHPSNVPEGTARTEAIKDELAKEFGKDAHQWRTHKLDIRQLTDNVVVRFSDGSSKKYKECTSEEKKTIETAMGAGLAASKGLNDYSQVTASSMKRNMENNLSHYDDQDIEEKKVTSTEPVSKEKASEFSNNVRENGKNLIRKYSKAFSSVSRKMADEYVDTVSDTLRESIADGSMAGVSESDLDEFIREDIKRIVSQEVETRGRSLGDHGARHIAGNVRSTINILGELKNGGVSLTGKQKLMAIAVQSNHDMGYTVGAVGYDIGKGKEHVNQSKQLATEEKGRYDKIFGEHDAQKVIDVIGSHDDFNMDWKNDPMAAAVRLADNTALFGNDKVQDLFIRTPDTIGLACKLRMVAEMIPDKPSEPKQEKYKDNPEKYKEDKKQYDADKKDYDELMSTPEMQKQVESSKKLQGDIKKQMHEAIDKGGFDEFDSDQLHHQLDEMSEGKFSTSVDILSRYSGKLKGFKYDHESGIMDVNLDYSPEGQTVDMVFGDSVSARQFDKFASDGKATPIKGKFGRTVFKDKDDKPIMRMNINGIDKDPVQSATSAPMKEFLTHTVRHELRSAADLYTQVLNGNEGKKAVKKIRKIMGDIKKKSTEEEWKKLKGVFKSLMDEAEGGTSFVEELESNKTPKNLAKKLTTWPPLEIENNYLSGKTASMVARVAFSIMASLIGDRIAFDIVAARGLQVNRKDRDVIKDTGGSSKTKRLEPEIKPPRDERKPFRTKNKTDEEKDSDVDRNKDKIHDSDMKTSSFESARASKAARELSRYPRRLADVVYR